MVKRRVTWLTVQDAAVKASVYRSQYHVMVYELTPLHHTKAELGVWSDLGGVDTLGHFPWVGEGAAINTLGSGERDSIVILWGE